jgi:hypothetical protein
MLISIGAEKAFEEIQHPFMIKTVMKQGIEGMFLNIIKTMYAKAIANIIINGEKLKPFPLKSGIRQECPFSPLLFHIELKCLVREMREKEMKGTQVGKEEVKLFLFADDMILCLNDQKIPPKNSQTS